VTTAAGRPRWHHRDRRPRPHGLRPALPYFLDHRGFAVLVETSRRVEVDLCASDPDVAWIEVIHDKPLQLVVLHGIYSPANGSTICTVP
jgi:hypothetical protein